MCVVLEAKEAKDVKLQDSNLNKTNDTTDEVEASMRFNEDSVLSTQRTEAPSASDTDNYFRLIVVFYSLYIYLYIHTLYIRRCY